MNDTQADDTQEEFHKVSSLSEYINEITDFRERIMNEGKSEILYFRGQSNSSWDIRPSIFRDSLVSAEYRIIQKAMARVPYEFKDCSSPFEELTKLQHYGLPTRLLDVTMNPLIALYFACSSSEMTKDEDGNDVYCDGIVYICQGYEEHEKSLKANVLSTIAQLDITTGTTLRGLKEKLHIDENYTPELFIDLIQDSVFVMPSYSNTRLIRQSGAFLITGAINVIVDDNDIWNSKVSKSVRTLNDEINKNRIFISGESKLNILDELDFVNINESTLFPELEHQMSHIKRVGSKWITTEGDSFVKFISKSTIENDLKIDLNKELSEENISRTVKKYVVSKTACRNIVNEIMTITKYPDWYMKENTRSSLIMNIKRQIKPFENKNARNIATTIVDELINKLKES